MTEDELERLAREIEAAAENVGNSIPPGWEEEEAYDYAKGEASGLKSAANMIREWPVESTWISVEDRLPPINYRVLAIIPVEYDNPTIASRDSETSWQDDSEYRCPEPTHWMPIPPPPA